jgi:hypothetical protein
MVSFLRPRSAELAVGVAYRLIGGGRGGPGGMPRGAPNPSEEKKEGIFVQRFQTPAQYGTELYPVQYSTQVPGTSSTRTVQYRVVLRVLYLHTV